MEERKYYPGMRLYTYNPKLFDALDDLKEAIRDNDLGKAEKKLAVLEAGLDLTNFYKSSRASVILFCLGKAVVIRRRFARRFFFCSIVRCRTKA